MKPDGKTPFYTALESLILETESGKKISVLTDGEDKVTKFFARKVRDLAQQKKISISILGIKLPKEVEDEMK